MESCRIYLLGSPYLTVGDQPIEFKRKKALALAAYLALQGQPCRRDTLLGLLWPDLDEERARAALRRTLAAITETPLRHWLLADRQTIDLRRDATLWVDVAAMRSALQAGLQAQASASSLYRDRFMAGFTLGDAAAFDDWQAAQAQSLETEFSQLLAQLADHYLERRMPVVGLETARKWLHIDPYLEAANLAYMRLLALANQPAAALQHFQRFAALLMDELGIAPSASLAAFVNALEAGGDAVPVSGGRIELLPPPPRLIIGRDDVLTALRERLAPTAEQPAPEVVIQGWPGIGKTTLSAAIAYDRALQQQYRDGVVWLAFGEKPDLRALLAQACQAALLGLPDPDDSLAMLSARLRAHFASRAVLLILDDIWEAAHALPFRVAGPGCAVFMSTRFNDVAHALVDRADQVYKVPLISDAAALQLLYALAPGLQHFEAETLALIHDLEGLPLALQVAGRLLHAEASMGWGIRDLVEELREGRRLLESQAPADRHEAALQTSPTIAALLQRSVAKLSEPLQERFALLGLFAPKPATFTIEALSAIWRDPQPQAAIRTLADRGLLEPTGTGRFQMHALLVMHARSLFKA